MNFKSVSFLCPSLPNRFVPLAICKASIEVINPQDNYAQKTIMHALRAYVNMRRHLAANFSRLSVKRKPNSSLWSITKGTDNSMSQSKPEISTCY